MATETKTEYETVEKEVEVTSCDMPNCIHNSDEDDMDFHELGVDPEMVRNDMYGRIYEKVGGSVDDDIDYKIESALHCYDFKANHTFDVCEVCLVKMLGVEAEDVVYIDKHRTRRGYDSQEVIEIKERNKVSLQETLEDTSRLDKIGFAATLVVMVFAVFFSHIVFQAGTGIALGLWTYNLLF